MKNSIQPYQADKRAEQISAASSLSDLIVYSQGRRNQLSLKPTCLTYKVVDGVLVRHEYTYSVTKISD